MTGLSRHSILSIKVRVQSRHTWGQHAIWVVSVCLARTSNAISSRAAFTLATLQPGWVYYGPSGIDDADLCKCNTVLYSLLSACGGCQGDSWMTYDSSCLCQSSIILHVSAIRWSEYTFNCSKVLPPSTSVVVQ